MTDSVSVTPGCLLCSLAQGYYSEGNVLIVAASSNSVWLCVTPLFHGSYGWVAERWLSWDPQKLGSQGSCWGSGGTGPGIQLMSMLGIALRGSYAGWYPAWRFTFVSSVVLCIYLLSVIWALTS